MSDSDIFHQTEHNLADSENGFNTLFNPGDSLDDLAASAESPTPSDHDDNPSTVVRREFLHIVTWSGLHVPAPAVAGGLGDRPSRVLSKGTCLCLSPRVKHLVLEVFLSPHVIVLRLVNLLCPRLLH